MSYRINPYKDEILYSVIARLFYHTLEDNTTQGLRNLFKNGNTKATIDLPSHLNGLYENYFHQIEDNVEDIIDKYTLYPFYKPFLKNEKRDRILSNLKSGSGSLIHIIAGINSSKIDRSRYPRYCPLCIAESRSINQEGYWQRIHQIPSVLVCPIHNIYVQEFMPAVSQLNHSLFIAAENLSDQSISLIVKNQNNTLLAFSKIFNDILNQRLEFDINTLDYLQKVKRSRFMRQSTINFNFLIDDMSKYYGVDTLKKYFPNERKPLQWVPWIIRRPKTYFEPLKHMLVSNYLEELDYKPTLFKDTLWDGPWKCINSVCPNYGHKNIKSADVYFDYRLKRTAALIKCECGFIYKMSLIIKNGIKKESIVVKDYGGTWKEKLLALKHQGKSIASIASQLGCSVSVIYRLLKAEKKNKSNDKDLKFQYELIKSRNEWIRLLNSFDFSKIVGARQVNYRLYKWLYNNDIEWLQITNKLHSCRSKSQRIKLDWQKIDSEFVSRISETYNQLKIDNFKGRITLSLLSKMINKEKNYISLNSEKLPQSKALIKEVIETTETYQLRKLTFSLTELKIKGEKLTMPKIIKNSRLKKVDNPIILRAIQEQLKELQFNLA